MYPDLARPRKIATVWSVIAAAAVVLSLFVWLGNGGQGPGAIGWSLLLLAVAAIQWSTYISLISTWETGAACTVRVTAYPGPGRLTVWVAPSDGTASFEAVIAGGSTPRPPLGTTHKARFRKAGLRAHSVILDNRLSGAGAPLPDTLRAAG